MPGRKRGGNRGSGGGGKRVNRESTCKQATRETNNVGAAGCSPPNEAGRQAGRRQESGSQADRQAGSCTFASSLRAPFSVRARSDESEYKRIASLRVFDLSNRARRDPRSASGEPPDDCTCAGSFVRLRPLRRRRRYENPPKFGNERERERARETGSESFSAATARRIRFGRFH